MVKFTVTDGKVVKGSIENPILNGYDPNRTIGKESEAYCGRILNIVNYVIMLFIRILLLGCLGNLVGNLDFISY